MEGVFEDFEAELTELKPEVRVKALEIAVILLKEGYDKATAIKEAIQEAETWFLDSEG